MLLHASSFIITYKWKFRPLWLQYQAIICYCGVTNTGFYLDANNPSLPRVCSDWKHLLAPEVTFRFSIASAFMEHFSLIFKLAFHC